MSVIQLSQKRGLDREYTPVLYTVNIIPVIWYNATPSIRNADGKYKYEICPITFTADFPHM
jgi:hypothetical protein